MKWLRANYCGCVYLISRRECNWQSTTKYSRALLLVPWLIALLFVQNMLGQIEISCSKNTWILVQLLKYLFIVQILARINAD